MTDSQRLILASILLPSDPDSNYYTFVNIGDNGKPTVRQIDYDDGSWLHDLTPNQAKFLDQELLYDARLARNKLTDTIRKIK